MELLHNTPLVSVLIPTYNVSKYINEAIGSILEQTYKNLEVIIVDDGSSDGTYELLEVLARTDSRIKLFKNLENMRIVETLNFALKIAKGEYIARMDGDDISLPERIAKQVEFLNTNKDVDLVGLNVIAIDDDGHELKRLKYSSNPINANQLVEYFSPVPHFWLARTSTYQKVGNYRIATVEDYDFLLRMSTLGLKFCNIQEFLYKQRIRQGNTATASGLIQRKLIEYVRALYFERLATNSSTDSYSLKELERLKEVGKLELYFFNISNRFMYSFSLFVQSNRLKAFYNFIFALIFSPVHQGRYFYRKYKYNRIIN